eukprot:3224506-Karenia_brevis.AAC.1
MATGRNSRRFRAPSRPGVSLKTGGGIVFRQNHLLMFMRVSFFVLPPSCVAGGADLMHARQCP